MNRVERRGQTAAGQAAPNRRLLMWLSIGIVIVAIVLAVAFASRVPKSAQEVHEKAAITVGATAPEFQASTTNGPFDLATATKPVFLEVFATWCPHCQRETQILNGLYDAYGSRVSFVAVSGSNVGMDNQTPESQADVILFAQHFGVKYPIAFDPDLAVAKSYLQSGFPTIAIIGTDKKIHALHDGEVPANVLTKDLKAVL